MGSAKRSLKLALKVFPDPTNTILGHGPHTTEETKQICSLSKQQHNSPHSLADLRGQNKRTHYSHINTPYIELAGATASIDRSLLNS